MKSRKLILVTAMTLFAALAIPPWLPAQDNRDHRHKHHHYKLIDMGTFGGPNVLFNFSGSPNRLLNNKGTATGGADTSTVDPFCFNNDCFVAQAFKWQEGVLTNLGTLGGSNSQGFWINDKGQIAGFAQNGMVDPLLGIQLVHAVVWSEEGTIVDLGTFGGYESLSQAINKRGHVVGMAANATPDPNAILGLGQQARAFLWDKDSGMRDLGTLGTGNDAFAQYVNDRGQVAGYSYTNTTANSTALCAKAPTQDPFFWEKGKMENIGTLGGVCGFATGLNNRGQVIGVSDVAGDISYHPFRWDKKGGLKGLITLGGNNGEAFGINDTGDAVGWANTAGDATIHAVLWRNGKTTPTDLGIIAGYGDSIAYAINSQGQIVGCSGCFQNGPAFLWEDGDMVDLNALVPPHAGIQLTAGDAYINDREEIVTSGVLSNGDTHAFLLTPCDENHGDSECDDEGESTAAMIQDPAPVDQTPADVNHGGLKPETLAALRVRPARRYRGFGAWPRE